ncbi:hypothetical protein Q8A67_006177 [Cirrhinus molitorella]|uniref:Uncharacterized protein n=1 Tax=Cirrhinus molitorella TaxID=172907 RepID=A0AA88TSI1_9TELE|nr:hypothetical protein Q8A67_006177 [Cirrhinus molitorella]
MDVEDVKDADPQWSNMCCTQGRGMMEDRVRDEDHTASHLSVDVVSSHRESNKHSNSEARKFSNGTKIYISVDSHQTESNDFKQHQTPWIILIITSVLLNVLLTIAVIGLVKGCLKATRRSKDTSEKPQSTTAAQNTNDPQYAEINFTKC